MSASVNTSAKLPIITTALSREKTVASKKSGVRLLLFVAPESSRSMLQYCLRRFTCKRVLWLGARVITPLRTYRDVSHVHIRLDWNDLQLQCYEESERSMRPRQGIKQIGVFVFRRCMHQIAVAGHHIIGEDSFLVQADLLQRHRLRISMISIEEPYLVGMRGHPNSQRQPSARRIRYFQSDR